MTENTIKWVAGLSNGETLVEGKGIVTHDTNSSAWAKLQQHLLNNNLTINSFGLMLGDRQWNLPSINQRFGGQVPLDYNCFRYEEANINEPPSVECIHADAIYQGFTVRLWVNMLDDNKCWIDIIAT
jgi:hypothetical protein